MSLQAYFESLQREHNVTSVEFVADQARGEGRLSSLSCSASCAASDASSRTPPPSDDEDDCLKQRPSFYTHSERLSSAPKCPLRSRENTRTDRETQISQLEAALEVLSMSLSELSQ